MHPDRWPVRGGPPPARGMLPRQARGSATNDRIELPGGPQCRSRVFSPLASDRLPGGWGGSARAVGGRDQLGGDQPYTDPTHRQGARSVAYRRNRARSSASRSARSGLTIRTTQCPPEPLVTPASKSERTRRRVPTRSDTELTPSTMTFNIHGAAVPTGVVAELGSGRTAQLLRRLVADIEHCYQIGVTNSPALEMMFAYGIALAASRCRYSTPIPAQLRWVTPEPPQTDSPSATTSHATSTPLERQSTCRWGWPNP